MKTVYVEILVAEDNSADAELMLEALAAQRLADHVHAVRDGEEALEFLFCRGAYTKRTFTSPPRLVLLDLKLPRVDGLEVLRMVKSDPRTQAIPIVVFTSSRMERDVAQSYRLGANSYVQKPVEFSLFRQTVERVGLFWLTTNEPPPPESFVGVA